MYQESEAREVSCGVIQGSTLGPLFFLILYINDLYKLTVKCKVYLVVDYISVIFSAVT